MLLLAGLNLLLAAGLTWVLKQQVLAKPSPRLAVRNYRQVDVPAAGGLVLAGVFVLMQGVSAALTLIGYPVSSEAPVRSLPASVLMFSPENQGLLIAGLGFFVFGLIDDVLEPGQAKGFKGHLAALRRGAVTGGLLKILGGGAAALAAGVFWETRLLPALLDAAIVALSANLLNLLDLRPGRAAKVFLLWWAPLAAASWQRPYLPASAAMASACAVWLPDDLRERGMLGDSGANLLGAIAGAGLALTLPEPGKLIALAALVFLTLASELWSFTSIIDKVAPIRWFDRLGRKFS